jgi:predicted PhzF superfamily epimerase YddE/YHI9
MAASYDFVQLDVFTQTPLAGNPMADPKRNYDSRRQT